MYKVLIVDDEPMIRQGLQTLVEWEQYQFEVCGVASNGLEALEKYKQFTPDLVLIDIRMPVMDGIRTIEELRKLGSNCKILILSGYGEFQYAQQAIRHRVDGYVLKPIDEEELGSFVEKISWELDKNQKQTQLASQTKEFLKEEWLKGFVAHSLGEEELDSSYWNAIFQADESQLRLMLVETYSRDHSLTRRNQIKQEIAGFVKDRRWGDVFSNETHICMLLYGLSMSDFKQERLEDELRRACGNSVHYVALISDEHHTIKELYEQVPSMIKLLQQRFFLNADTLCTIEEITNILNSSAIASGAKHEHEELSTEQASQKLLYSLDVGNKKYCKDILAELAAQFRAADLSEQQVKTNWAQLLTVVMNRLSSSFPKQQFEQDLKIVTQLYLTHHYDEMLQLLQDKLFTVIDRINQSDGSNTTVMKQLIDFINRHYMDPLRLETLAEIYNYNSGYLGKLFKNYTGESFNTYLDQVRMEQAVIKLKEGKKVHQVAEMVGYANVDYFHSKFKKYMGVSPSAYKPGGSQSNSE